MDRTLILNIIGYAGSALVLISFLMASVLKLRIVNIAGSVASVVYSLLIKAYPTVVMNVALIIINVFFIVKMLKQKNIYQVVETNCNDAHLEYFLKYYGDDIRSHFPEFSGVDSEDIIMFLYCESSPASVFVGKTLPDDAIEVFIDYSTPQYRDCSAGQFIYDKLAKAGITKVVLRNRTIGHEAYLKRMGFVSKDGVYEKTLKKPVIF